jgi:hypothetical protein
MMTKLAKIVYTVLLIAFGFSNIAKAQIINFTTKDEEINLADKLSIFIDSSSSLTTENIVQKGHFETSKTNFLNFKITNGSVWLKFSVKNESEFLRFKLCIDDLNINEVSLYNLDSNGLNPVGETYGQDFVIINKDENVPGIIFNLKLENNKTETFYMKLNNKGQLFVPIYLRTVQKHADVWLAKFIIFGIYVGIIAALFFYNLFLSISITDDKKSYWWYLFHTLFILLTQASFQGYTLLFLWPNSHFLANQSINIFTCLVSISGIEYAKAFLHLKVILPKINKVISFFHILYFIVIVLSLMGHFDVAYQLLQPVQSAIAIIMLIISFNLVLKKSRDAFFYFISWSVLFISILCFVLTNIGIIPYNTFTSQIMLYGSAIQVILLSIAQADKYNLLKIEEQKAQNQTIVVSRINEEITKEQNVKLEKKVQERTNELTNANNQLNETLNMLKDTQIQLVEKEKMSSLGQLTAGIAHEINNPINFVSGNIKPLKRDVNLLLDLITQIEEISKQNLLPEQKTAQINALKNELDFEYLNEEIMFLLKGIEEGANRTTEIVKGLKVFSRSDEFETKFADIHDGINSTLILLNNQLGNKIKIEKYFEAENSVIEHFPGKINQVFMNLLSNAIYAVSKRWGNQDGGKITIRTKIVNGKFMIEFADNGIGMSQEVIAKMFDPFFTTKDVGEGTGLGMSIVYKTIDMHKGKISVTSKVGEGTTFTIEIPNKLEIQNI